MRNLFIVLLSSVLIYACSGTKDAMLGTLSQEPCRNESKITEENVFTGESVENLKVFQQGSNIYAVMDVRTTCNTKLAADLGKKEGQFRLKLINTSNQTADCVCISTVSVPITDVEEGNYKVTVVNSQNQLLAQQDIWVEDKD